MTTTNPKRHRLAKPASRLDFETLISNLSARFVSLRAAEVDRGIEEALEQVRKFFQGGRCGLLRVHQGEGAIRVSHAVYEAGLPHVSKETNLADLFPWTAKRLVEDGETVAISKMSELPPEAEVDRRSWAAMGVRSSLTVPLQIGGGFRRIMVLDSLRQEVVWPDAYVPRLRLLGEIFVRALERRRTELLLARSETRLRLAAESANLGLWELDIETGRFWVTDRIRRFFGYEPDDEVTLEDVLQRIHPEDRESARQALEDAIRGDAEGSVEYRVLRRDGTLRWLAARGRPQRGPSGATDRVLGVTFDVTERKEAEVALRDDAERIAAAADVAQLGYYEAFEGEAPRVLLDTRLKEMLGLPPGDEGRVIEHWAEHLHPEDKDRVLEVQRSLLSGEEGRRTAQYRYRHPSRGERWFEHSVRALECDAEGQVVRRLGAIHDITEHRRAEDGLRRALAETERLKNELQQQNLYLSKRLKERIGARVIVGESEPLLEMLAAAKRVAPTDTAVLITGETGTGKELLAQTIHDLSPRRDKPMVTVNCAALPATLIENELFGREKGAYTGAVTQQTGRFELADGSTLFLDEIAELPLDLQSKLLRVLQEGRFERLGSHRTRTVDVRVIAATNRDMRALLRQGDFRSDLYYRLNVFPIQVPPLRERREDIPLLVWGFVRHFSEKMGKPITSVPRRTMESLQGQTWPGNVRELKNTIERAVILSDRGVLRVDAFATQSDEISRTARLEEVERRHILETLQRTNWRIGGENGAAEQLGLNRTTLHSKLKKLGISRPNR